MFKKAILLTMAFLLIWKYNELIKFYDYFLQENEKFLTDNIIKPKQDKRTYKAFQLENKLTVFLIHDPESDKSAASLSVGVGASLDPKTHPGTAHFLEHMLFQGSEKYPDASEYMNFMSDHGGHCNAFTSLTETNYHFMVSNEALEEGLDRMAQFFISPSFSAESAEKEVNAVDSEYNMSLQNPGWHMLALSQFLAAKDSVYNRFWMGNKQTLQAEGMRDNLLNFHKKWYSANIMNLVAISNQPIDEMEKWATEKFSVIKNFDVEIPNFEKPEAFPVGQLNKTIEWVPITDTDELVLFWPLPQAKDQWKSKPFNYLIHLFGHQGEKSLLSFLKSEGLVLDLHAGVDNQMDSFNRFILDITLTEKGMNKWQRVVEIVFQYAQNIENHGPQQEIFDEIKHLGKMNFEFQNKKEQDQEVVGIASTLRDIGGIKNVNEIFKQAYIVDNFESELIQNYTKMITSAENFGIFLSSQKFELKFKDDFKQVPFYDTKFREYPIEEELWSKIKNPKVEFTSGKELDLPVRNDMIPKNFDILPEAEKSVPEIITETQETVLWYLKDDKFKQPKADVWMRIYTNDNNYGKTIDGRLCAIMWSNVVDQYIKEYHYLASIASLSFTIDAKEGSIDLNWSGFSDSLYTFMKNTLQKISEMPDQNLEDLFDRTKEAKMIQWKNDYLDQSYKVLGQLIVDNIQSDSFEKVALREYLSTYTYSQFKASLQTWLKNGRTVCFVYGNVSQVQAQAYLALRQRFLPLDPIPLVDIKGSGVIKPVGNHMVNMEVLDKTNENSAFATYYQIDKSDSNDERKRLSFALLVNYIGQPFFNDLRTEQQLGYIVGTQEYSRRNVYGFQFIVQSAQHSAEFCIDKANEFLLQQRKLVNEMSDEDFEVQRASLMTDLKQKDKNMDEVSSRMWRQIAISEFDFDKQEKQAKLLEEITKQEFIKAFENIFFSDKIHRVDYTLNSAKHSEENLKYTKLNNAHVLGSNRQIWNSIEDFKANMEYHEDEQILNYKKQFQTK